MTKKEQVDCSAMTEQFKVHRPCTISLGNQGPRAAKHCGEVGLGEGLPDTEVDKLRRLG